MIVLQHSGFQVALYGAATEETICNSRAYRSLVGAKVEASCIRCGSEWIEAEHILCERRVVFVAYNQVLTSVRYKPVSC